LHELCALRRDSSSPIGVTPITRGRTSSAQAKCRSRLRRRAEDDDPRREVRERLADAG
jgi:hypothetical protein